MRIERMVLALALTAAGCPRESTAPQAPKTVMRPAPATNKAMEKKVEKSKEARRVAVPVLDYAGTARDAKGGAALVLEHGAVVYVGGKDRWDEQRDGKAVVVRGRLVRGSSLPVATTSPPGAVSQGVDPRRPEQWVIDDARIVEKVGSPVTLPLELARGVWDEARACLDSVAVRLRADGEDPSGFHVVTRLGQTGDELRLSLWHESAFAAANQHKRGNPGGKCRDAVCDASSGKLLHFLWWQ